MATCGPLEWTQKRAEKKLTKPLPRWHPPDTPWRRALIGLAHIAVERDRYSLLSRATRGKFQQSRFSETSEYLDDSEYSAL